MTEHNRMTAEEIATQIRASDQIVERRETPERAIDQEAEKIKQFALQVATEAVNEDARTVTYDTSIQAEAVAICHRRILKNIKKRLNDEI